ncbi:hypothetical protein [Halogeometricum limi]|uniref:Uncharacterized protein n=1 Tax=Halogeometricum limi TaxID=555875 RepID=A0A1I6IQ72_9EURY|nr:hypothetical protein [Halogeometricum limi]SFR68884.1 hypothetical protein SAMN04488124_3491 [Halogeometricum limi]
MTDDADAEETADPERDPAESDATDGDPSDGTSDAAGADGEDPDAAVEDGGVDDAEDGSGDDGADDAEMNGAYDDTVPNVELGLYQLSVRVSGRSDDDLKTVEDSAKRLMDYLIDRAEELEERPDDRGLS